MTQTRKISLIILTLMLLSTYAAHRFTATKLIADQLPPIQLAQRLPAQFGDWHQLPENNTSIVNPELGDLLGKIYQEILTRTYADSQGNLVLMSIAYGRNQSADNAVHRPEICYPAQGFGLMEPPVASSVHTSYGSINVRRLVASKRERIEPITYWIMVGDNNVRGVFETKKQLLKYGLKGYIPDGMIFRISSIMTDKQQAFAVQNRFLEQLVSTLSADDRSRLIGLHQ